MKRALVGGDAQYWYLGTARVDKGVVNVEVAVTHYAGPTSSVFGAAQHFNLVMAGRIAEPVMELEGYLVEAPAFRLRARFTKRAELP